MKHALVGLKLLRRVNLRQRRTILRKIEAIKENPIMAPAVYRLFTFIPWENIPKEHKNFFPPEAETEWDKDLKDYKENHLILDLDAEVKAVLKALTSRLIIQALAIVPIILADYFVLGYPMDNLQRKLQITTDNFITNNMVVSKDEAETIAMFEIIDILEEIITKVNLDISNNFQKVIIDISNKYIEDNKSKKQYNKVMEVMGSERINE